MNSELIFINCWGCVDFPKNWGPTGRRGGGADRLRPHRLPREGQGGESGGSSGKFNEARTWRLPCRLGVRRSGYGADRLFARRRLPVDFSGGPRYAAAAPRCAARFGANPAGDRGPHYGAGAFDRRNPGSTQITGKFHDESAGDFIGKRHLDQRNEPASGKKAAGGSDAGRSSRRCGWACCRRPSDCRYRNQTVIIAQF